MLARFQSCVRRHRSSHAPRQGHSARPRVDAFEDRVLLATLPAGFSEVAAASGLSGATALEFSPDGKLFVTEQAGTMEVWQGGTRLRANFFQDAPLTTYNSSTDIGRIDNRGERGLLGVTFDPNYASNRFVYAYYTYAVNPDGNTGTATTFRNRVARFTANAAGDLAVPGSEQVILELDNLSGATNHNGGALHFGPDGKLYVAVGDNASGANAQSLATRHGKILRINADGTIPSDNPFSTTATGANRAIWALGLRNPYTFSFQPGTGRMHINDVGQNTWEEINVGVAGANYGWPTTEGDFNQSTYPTFARPFYAYSHGGGTFQGYAITGGAFYSPASPGPERFPAAFDGDYFFADFVNDWINVVDVATGEATRFASNAPGTVDLRVAADGSLYYLARDAGTVSRVTYSAGQAPTITGQPQAQTVGQGASATFTVVASGSSPLTYRWQRAEAGTTAWTDIGGATGASYTVAAAQASDDGNLFRAIVSNAFGTQTSSAAALTVSANRAPAATIAINSGLTGGKFVAGQPIAFAASATDPEDGPLAPARLTWRVEYITSINSGNPAIRPFVPDTGGQATGSFTPATTGPYTLTDVAYRITLTATDSAGRSTTVTRDVVPNVATLTIATDPTGLQVTVDGQPFASPRTFDSVAGFERPIGAAVSQALGGSTYNFASWSDGGAATHTISTPLANTTYTARYTPTTGGSSGLLAEFFDFTSGLSSLPSLSGRTPDVSRIDAALNYPSTDAAWSGLDSRFADTFASRHTGNLRVDAAGTYTFYLSSDDGSRLWVDGQLVVDNDGLHGMQERSASRTLSAGLHSVRVEFFENGGSAGVVLAWSGPGIAKQAIPASRFSQPTAAARFASAGSGALTPAVRTAQSAGGGSVRLIPLVSDLPAGAQEGPAPIKLGSARARRVKGVRPVGPLPSRSSFGFLVPDRIRDGETS